MSNELRVRVVQELSRFLSGEISVNEFQSWLVGHTWRLTLEGAVADLVSEIELRIIETGNGDWTLDELKVLLWPLVDDSPAARERAAAVWPQSRSESQVV